MNSDRAIQDIKIIEQSIKDLEHILALLSWDQETGMPEAAAGDRARQMGMIQDKLTLLLQDPGWPEWLSYLQENGDEQVQMWYRLLNRRYKEYQVLPPDFMTRFVEAGALARESWLKARDKDDFQIFAPALKFMVTLLQERCGYSDLKDEPYDVLLDIYEPGMKASVMEVLFDRMESDLSPLIDLGVESLSVQKRISVRVLEDMGYDFKAGRLDFSVHPFTTTLGSRDIRVTTAFDENAFFSGLSSTIHEGGHGLYEQNLPPAWYGTIVSEACSLGFHESQSRLWENIIGRSQAFCVYLKRIIEQEMSNQNRDINIDIDIDELFQNMNRVERRLIRVNADELTYNQHIFLRFRLERALINGTLQVDDLSNAWDNESFKLLGIQNQNDLSGILQDIHWSSGDMGYFPTYTLGNLYSAQIWKQLRHDLRDVDFQIEQGQFGDILKWLKEHIHSKGALYSSTELMRSLSGSDPDSSSFIDYLEEKQKELYA
jgi:carboxypeptidase Taq